MVQPEHEDTTSLPQVYANSKPATGWSDERRRETLSMTTRILLIRHGQTTWNREARFRGQADVPLDETGVRQAQATAAYVAARWPLQAVYTSPLSRARDTATAIAAAQGLTPQHLAGLLDIHFGDWQGMALSDIQQRYPDMMRVWAETPHRMHFPNGESLNDVRQRATAALQATIAAHPQATAALVAHTVVNQVLLCAVLDLGNDHFWAMAQETCAVNVIEWNGNRYRLTLMNDTSHLWQQAQ